MKKLLSINSLCLCAILLLLSTTAQAVRQAKLWYTHPAQEWFEGLPLGNGHLMAVVLGDVYHETIQMNEETLWSGQFVNLRNPEAAQYLNQVRQLMFQNKYKEAETLAQKKLLGTPLETGLNCYQTLGNLDLAFVYPDPTLPVTAYHRELDLDKAMITITYKIGETNYKREVFISAPDQALVMRISSNQADGINCYLRLNRQDATLEIVNPNHIVMKGKATCQDPNWGGVHYEAQLNIESPTANFSKQDRFIHVSNTKEMVIRFVAATDYRKEDPHQVCTQRIEKAESKDFKKLLTNHLAEYQTYYRRVQMDLTDPASKKMKNSYYHGWVNPTLIPTNERLEAVGQGIADPELTELYFDYGRYLLISASRPGSLAINLWGKWVNSYLPSYEADYHTNINIPMNYWPAEVCNLSECHQPFFDLIDSMRPHGRITAQKTYHCGGFVAHHATDPWYYTAAIGNPPYGLWPMTPAWASHQMWDAYLFTGNQDYLTTKLYPIMKESAEFFIDYLVKDPRSGYLVAGPSTSPENRFLTPEGESVSLSMGTTMDMQLVRDLFQNCITASQELGTDVAFRQQLQQLIPQLLPMQIGTDGRLLEWAHPFKEKDLGHKHISHLWGLCEGNLITPSQTPKLATAAKESLDMRVAHGTAKTKVFRAMTSWIAQSYARLGDGNKAYKQIKYIIGQSSLPNLMAVSYQGINRRMFETDANLGCTLAIAEMFVQSQEGFIHLLPALPTALRYGKIKGLCARGGFEVALNWKKGVLTTVTVNSLLGKKCDLRYQDKIIHFDTQKGKSYTFDATLQPIKAITTNTRST